MQRLWDGAYSFSSLSEKTRKSNILQMSSQRQHFLLSYLKTLIVGPAGTWTSGLPLGRPALNQLSWSGSGSCYVMERRTRLIETLHDDVFFQVVFLDHLRHSDQNPTLLSSLATFRFLLKRKGRCKRLSRREMERRNKKVSLNLFTFSGPSLSYTTSELSYFVCFYHILTSSVIYYWTDPGQHGMYLFGREVTGFCGVKSNMKDFSFRWHWWNRKSLS